MDHFDDVTQCQQFVNLASLKNHPFVSIYHAEFIKLVLSSHKNPLLIPGNMNPKMPAFNKEIATPPQGSINFFVKIGESSFKMYLQNSAHIDWEVGLIFFGSTETIRSQA